MSISKIDNPYKTKAKAPSYVSNDLVDLIAEIEAVKYRIGFQKGRLIIMQKKFPNEPFRYEGYYRKIAELENTFTELKEKLFKLMSTMYPTEIPSNLIGGDK